jgi:hypothetical protein
VARLLSSRRNLSLSRWRLRYASVILRLSSSLLIRSMFSRSRPSRRPSSWICRANSSTSRSTSMSAASEEPIRERRDDWCSMWRLCLSRKSSTLRLDSLLLLRLCSDLDPRLSGDNLAFCSARRFDPLSAVAPRLCWRSRVRESPVLVELVSRVRCELVFLCLLEDPWWRDLEVDGSPFTASSRLISRTELIRFLSRSSRRSCSAVRSGMFNLGSTLSPGLYLASISSFSESGFAFSGCAASIMSKSEATVALCLVSRTGARHDGHVKTEVPGGGGSGPFSTAWACHANQSFKQAPQKVCRQSRSVRGW